MPLRDGNGEIVGTFGLSRDITQRKLAEMALRSQADRMARIIETQRDIAAAELDLQAVMDLICLRTQELTNAESGTILLLEDGEFVHRAATGFMADKIGARVVIKGSLTGWCYERGEAAICEDTEVDPRVSGRARRRGIRSMVIVPLRHHDETVGMLEVLSQEPDAFNEEDRNTLELLSVVLSSALS